MRMKGRQDEVREWTFTSGRRYADPFNTVELDTVFEDDRGGFWRVPAFWAGGQTWRVRFAPPAPGRYRYTTACSDTRNRSLHGLTGTLEAAPRAAGGHALHRHGPVRVAADRRHFEHADGTPFFWLGDTWWMGLTKRLSWPGGFRTLVADRVAKRFSVVQIVAGLYPDMPWMDVRGANEAGFPWDREFRRLNSAYFDKADRRIRCLVEAGLVPCIVGCWGYFLPWMGVPKMKQHWRHLVARWSAYPVVWCLAGEGTMPYYLSTTKEADARFQKQGWTEVGAYVRQLDPYRHTITVHPSSSARLCVEDPSVLDFDMLQTGHGDRGSLPNTVRVVTQAYHATPAMPVVEGEVCYEGIGEFCRQEVQRLMFWACLLNGAAGFTYGANGIWQVNTRRRPYGPSPHGMSWGNTPWEDAYRLPGSEQLGVARRILARYPWWQLEPHPEWVEPGWTQALFEAPFTCGRHDIPLAAGIPGRLHIIYQMLGTGLKRVKGLNRGGRYRLRLVNPVTGTEPFVGEVKADQAGQWEPAIPGLPAWCPRPIFQDWLLILEAK